MDQYGVLHDGKDPHLPAIKAVARMAANDKKILILSNSSRSKSLRAILPRSAAEPSCRLCHLAANVVSTNFSL
jgi:hypothetical protein